MAVHVKEAEAEACPQSKAGTTHNEALDSLVLGDQHPCRGDGHVGLGLRRHARCPASWAALM